MICIREFFILLFLINTVYGQECKGTNRNITLILIGRSGMGVSTSAREIIGNKKLLLDPQGTSSPLTEYQVSIPGHQGSFLKLVDVEGIVDGKSSSNDEIVLNSLNSYLSNPTGLNGSLPDFFVLISNFDDTEIQNRNSIFKEILRKVSTIQKLLYNSIESSNAITILLLTRFMSSTRATRRRPENHIETFRTTIRDTLMSNHSIDIVIGENLGSEFDLLVRDGLTELPNGDYYPENLFNSLIDIANGKGDSETAYRIELLLDDRESKGEVYSEFFNHPDTNNDNQENIKLSFITEEKYDQLDPAVKETVTKLQLQNYLESVNLTTICQLPKKLSEKLKFYQNLPAITIPILKIMNTIFNLSLPQILLNPIVGYGFDIFRIKSLEITPFLSTSLIQSPMGYLVPSFFNCVKFQNPESVNMAHFFETLHDYVSFRHSVLGMDRTTRLNTSYFVDRDLISGYNIRPNPSTRIASLSTLREIRIIKCKLPISHQFTTDFRKSVSALLPLNQFNLESVEQYKTFFEKYGTHVVSQAFGGGYIEGSITDRNIKQVIDQGNRLNQTFQAILNWGKLQNFTEKPNYNFFGGNAHKWLENPNDLEPLLRKVLIQNWIDSLIVDPLILENNLVLTPISAFAKQVNPSLSLEIEVAWSKYLRGSLNVISLNKEYSDNPVGQAYHMLKEKVLATSPFDNLAYESDPRHTVSCITVRGSKFKNLQNYVETRLKTAFKIDDVPSETASQFKGRVLPGNFILDWNTTTNQTFNFEVEVRKQKFRISNPESLVLDNQFKRMFADLPTFEYWTDLDCKGRGKWREFLDTFGTHYIKTSYNGDSYIDKGLSDNEKLKDTKGICQKISSGMQKKLNSSDVMKKSHTGFLNSSLEFVSYMRFVAGNVPLLVSFNEALYQLMKNGLSC